MKFTKAEYKLKNEKMLLKDITLDLVKEILYSKKRKKDYLSIVKDDGRLIMWFRTAGYEEDFTILSYNDEKEPWFKIKEKTFSFSDEFENYNIVVAEYYSNDLCEHKQAEDMDAAIRFHYGIKEDTGNYSIYDVYSEKELL